MKAIRSALVKMESKLQATQLARVLLTLDCHAAAGTACYEPTTMLPGWALNRAKLPGHPSAGAKFAISPVAKLPSSLGLC